MFSVSPEIRHRKKEQALLEAERAFAALAKHSLSTMTCKQGRPSGESCSTRDIAQKKAHSQSGLGGDPKVMKTNVYGLMCPNAVEDIKKKQTVKKTNS